MSKKHITCIHIIKNVAYNAVHRVIFITTIIFAVSAHLFMNTYVFNNFHQELMQTILNESKKMAQHIARENDINQSKVVLDKKMHQIQDDFNIKKIKLFDANGFIIYSTNESDIGTKTTHEEFFSVIAKGEVYYQIIKDENQNNAQIAEIYVPLIKNNIFVGASEIYYDMTTEITSLNQLVISVQKLHIALILLSVGIIFAMLYISSKNNLIRTYNHEKNKNLEISLQQHSRLSALAEMLENIAHQWRQPLSCITTLMSGIKIKQEMNILTPEDITDANEGILRNANFLSDTIEHFKQFTKTQGEIKEFNVSNTIKNTLKIVDSTFKSLSINIELNLDETIVYEGIDKELSQALLNILINAKDAFLLNKIEQRLIKITLLEKEMYYEIYIQDNALGINETIKDKIFDPYFTTKHQYSGTGLGLYISSQIVKIQFNGEILTYNFKDKDSQGACFIIKLPKIVD